MERISTVALVEDHPLMRLGVEQMLTGVEEISFLGGYPTLQSLLGDVRPDIVLLDLRLRDDSTPRDNVITARNAGCQVLIYTSADDPYLVRTACQAGAVGVVRKSDSQDELVQALLALANGSEVAGLDWAAAIDSDEHFITSVLTDTEREVLAEYACGLTSQQVATKLSLSLHTVNTYVRNIRIKYQQAGRDAESRVDLYLRAVEDSVVPATAWQHHDRS